MKDDCKGGFQAWEALLVRRHLLDAGSRPARRRGPAVQHWLFLGQSGNLLPQLFILGFKILHSAHRVRGWICQEIG